MEHFIFYVLIITISSLLIATVTAKYKGYVAIASVTGLSIISSILSFRALSGVNTTFVFDGSIITGEIPLVIDPLAAWFILVINFTFITSSIYGNQYMSMYKEKKANLSLHWISFILSHAGLLAVCSIQNSIAFLIAWEIMAVSTFILVIFEGHKSKVIGAGINYLIQSHILILFLTIAFIWVAIKTNSFGFDAISRFVLTEKPLMSFLLMFLFFIGFGIKAGFVPLHTWLPHAHPAAPSHVSAMMSGVMIKIGIYGILRMVLLVNINYLATGYFILIISVITGIYGVMLALVQHNIKRLLAYHSVENIGIIGMGIGLGCIGLGQNNMILSGLGFSGALLHTLNHSLFKSLLFYSAGNIYMTSHTMNIEKFGGLIKKMPHTAFLFLIAALAICGLPPFNGFVSEFIIYSGLFNGLQESNYPYVLILVFSIFGLALIGGLAVFCFTKAFGSVFLGVPRYQFKKQAEESNLMTLFPMYLIVILIICIGIFPQVFTKFLSLPVSQFTGNLPVNAAEPISFNYFIINRIGIYSLGFIVLILIIYFIRTRINVKNKSQTSPTWGCGYVAPNYRMQYTASSFVKNYTKLAKPLLMFKRLVREVEGIFPGKAGYQSHPQDKAEEYLINWPLRKFRYFLGLFSFLQNGRLQFYILYGMVFILVMISIPFFIYIFQLFVNFLNTL